jgi:hypothetical protein
MRSSCCLHSSCDSSDSKVAPAYSPKPISRDRRSACSSPDLSCRVLLGIRAPRSSFSPPRLQLSSTSHPLPQLPLTVRARALVPPPLRGLAAASAGSRAPSTYSSVITFRFHRSGRPFPCHFSPRHLTLHVSRPLNGLPRERCLSAWVSPRARRHRSPGKTMSSRCESPAGLRPPFLALSFLYFRDALLFAHRPHGLVARYVCRSTLQSGRATAPAPHPPSGLCAFISRATAPWPLRLHLYGPCATASAPSSVWPLRHGLCAFICMAPAPRPPRLRRSLPTAFFPALGLARRRCSAAGTCLPLEPLRC